MGCGAIGELDFRHGTHKTVIDLDGALKDLAARDAAQQGP